MTAAQAFKADLRGPFYLKGVGEPIFHIVRGLRMPYAARMWSLDTCLYLHGMERIDDSRAGQLPLPL